MQHWVWKGQTLIFVCTILLLSIFIFANTNVALAQQDGEDGGNEAYYFDYNSECQTAYREIMALRLDNARSIVRSELENYPYNILPHLLDEYIDFFRAYIKEEDKDINQLLNNKSTRLDWFEKGDKTSPFYLYCQSEILLHSAIVRMKDKQYVKAFWEVRKAFKLLEQNHNKFPDFYPNLKTLGILHTLVGIIPEQYQWGVKILGMEGDVNEGLAELEEFIRLSKKDKKGQQMFLAEGNLIYTFLLVYVGDKEDKAWTMVQELPLKNNLLNHFMYADIALRTGHTDDAIRVLENKPQGQAYLDLYMLDYFLGFLKLYRLDAGADIPIKKFTDNFKGQHYIKDAYQKLAWHSLLQDDEKGYHQYMELCKTKGNDMLDADRQALKDAQAGIVPHIGLLKSRLLFDGAYYQRALDTLKNIPLSKLQTKEHQIEHSYRQARIYDKLRQYDLAIAFYQQTIQESVVLSGYYFAPKSCLELAKIYERQNETEKAGQYFSQCLQYKNYEYKNSIDQQAKAGLQRLRKK